jgi:N-ethylmaleimide reductase
LELVLVKYPRLFEPLDMGALKLRNRILMAPMTRSRATDDDRVTSLQVTYYRQRASAGLIFSEGVHPSPNGKGYCRTPGIFNDEQVEAWRAVTDAVHAEGGLMACQLMHCGRVAHPENKAPGTRTLAPSAIAAAADIFTDAGMQPMPLPEAMTEQDIRDVVQEYAEATRRCMDAGFDAVELHCAAGYLPAQFLASGSNQRTDAYGGDVAGRLRFIREVLEAMIGIIGAGRVGIRIAPGNPYNDHIDADPEATYGALAAMADALGLAWVHTIRTPASGIDALALTRAHYTGTVIGSDGFDAAEADEHIDSGQCDAVSFGRAYIANPDLVDRFAADGPFNDLDETTVYAGGGAAGYTDYPTLLQFAASRG